MVQEGIRFALVIVQLCGVPILVAAQLEPVLIDSRFSLISGAEHQIRGEVPG